MRTIPLLTIAFLVVSVVGLSQPSGTQKPKAPKPTCDVVSGKWILEETDARNKIEMTVNQTQCAIQSNFVGHTSGLHLHGQWDEHAKVFKFDGEVTIFENKCQMEVKGQAEFCHSKLKISITYWPSTRCPKPDELNRELVWSRRP